MHDWLFSRFSNVQSCWMGKRKFKLDEHSPWIVYTKHWHWADDKHVSSSLQHGRTWLPTWQLSKMRSRKKRLGWSLGRIDVRIRCTWTSWLKSTKSKYFIEIEPFLFRWLKTRLLFIKSPNFGLVSSWKLFSDAFWSIFRKFRGRLMEYFIWPWLPRKHSTSDLEAPVHCSAFRYFSWNSVHRFQ